MKRLSVLLACLLFLIKPASAADMEMRQLTPGIWIISHSYPYPANMVLVEMNNQELVLVDSTYTDAAAEELLGWIRARFGQRRLTAINTHFHVDRIGGNAALIARGIPVWGSDAIAPLLRQRGEAMRRLMVGATKDYPQMAADYAKMAFTPPSHTFPLQEGLTLRFGTESIHVLFTGEGHAPDNVSVWFPSRRLLVGGCMILAGKTRGNTSDANLAAWAASVRDLQRLEPAWVIPGHGSQTTPILLQHTLQILTGP